MWNLCVEVARLLEEDGPRLLEGWRGGGGDKNMDQTLSSGPKSRRLYIDKPDWRQVA